MEYQMKMNIPEISTSGHAYLDELDYNPRPFSYTNPNDRRVDEWKRQRATYGFDETETWDLNYTFYAWLYEHLRMYVDCSEKIINLEYHKFEWNGETYTQLAIIQMMIERLQFYFSEDYNDFDEYDTAYVREIGELWALVLPAMWW